MSQSKANYELMRNDNNTFAVRGEWDGGSEVTVDTALDGTSTNPVENKAIVSALNNKEPKSVLGAFDNGQPVTDTNTIYAIENNVIIRNAGGAYMPMIRLANTAYYAGFDSTAKKATYIVFNKANDEWTPTLTTYYIQERLSGETGYDATKVQGLINNQGDLAWKDQNYTYATALTGSSGTITSATALISAIQNKTPITFTINGTTATFIHVLTSSGESDYMCAYLDGNVVTHIMHLNPDTENNQVAWTSVNVSIPSPDHTSDGGKVLKASTTTDGEYDLGALSVDVSNIHNSANHATETLYVNSNSAGNNIAYGKPASSFGLGTITTAPTGANTDGIKIVVLSSEPATKYSGYLYIVTGS